MNHLELLLGILISINFITLYMVFKLNTGFEKLIDKLNAQQTLNQKILHDIFHSLNKSNEYLHKISSFNDPLKYKVPYNKQTIV